MELSEFLHEVGFAPRRGPPRRVAFHDCCAGLRELGIKAGPRALLEQTGVSVEETPGGEQCCGFGGTFAEKFGAISSAIAERKCAALAAAGVKEVVMGDTGCMLHVEGRLLREGTKIRVSHWAEVLAATV